MRTKCLTAVVTCCSLTVASLALAQAASAQGILEWMMGVERTQRMLDSVAAEIPKLVTYLVFLGLGWLIGRRLTVLWSRHQKENEQDLDAARDFHALYGDFFALWKSWNYYVRDLGAEALPGASRWELLDRACKSEARLEATFARLASQRSLTADEIDTLGRFRQRYQQLRESIRDNMPLAWDHSEHPDYVEFKMLAPQVAAIIAGSDHVRKKLLLEITSNIYEVPNRRRRIEPDQREAA